MTKTKKVKCPFCGKVYTSKKPLYNHMIGEHEEQLNGLSPAHVYFNIKNNKTHGTCIICGKETQFNEVTEKYERLCSETCKQRYREIFKERMIKRYGKETLTDDPEQQLKMQANRKIAGTYRWSDGAKFKYLGSYEKHALEYLDKTLKLKSQDVMAPAPISLKYTYDGKDRFYMPDFLIVPFNLLVEVKGTNNHYQKRDKGLEEAKDKAAMNSEYKYVKIVDKNYKPLVNLINELKEND